MVSAGRKESERTYYKEVILDKTFLNDSLVKGRYEQLQNYHVQHYLLGAKTNADGYVSIYTDIIVPGDSSPYGWAVSAFQSWGLREPAGLGHAIMHIQAFGYFPSGTASPVGLPFRVYIAIQAFYPSLENGEARKYTRQEMGVGIRLLIPTDMPLDDRKSG